MDRVTQAKLALVLMAAIFFGGSLRYDLAWARWVAIALLIVALTLRFLRRGGPRE